jgi:hypothetical protein
VSAAAVNEVVTITNDKVGNVTDAADGAAATGFTIAVTQQGVASNLNSSYFKFQVGATSYYAWFNVNSEGVDPAVADHTGVEIVVAAGAADTAVATALAAAIDPLAGVGAAAADAVVTVTNSASGVAVDAADGVAATGFTFEVTQQGQAAGERVLTDAKLIISYYPL